MEQLAVCSLELRNLNQKLVLINSPILIIPGSSDTSGVIFVSSLKLSHINVENKIQCLHLFYESSVQRRILLA